ncbi:GNAT family N-acetyltransferase [Listeria booriae]|uniref:GNAT family N-acetyltransferase n=1 Tax=Listeria booriae TaxID=1552123 RepID=UPI001E286A8D|nr:GNAT family N-acetyltransferase [Listeria booriae]MDT0109973.1 GNAT family N-acetyltransferase [Listeria booriae]
MPNLHLELMKQADFATFSENLSIAYAEDKVEAGTWLASEALANAKQSMRDTLPNGVNTPNHFIWDVIRSHEKVGTLWVCQEEQSYFIYDIIIFEAFQNQGLGSELLAVLEEEARAQGITEIGLHVFGHNKRAIHVYEKMGFETTDISMRKRI